MKVPVNKTLRTSYFFKMILLTFLFHVSTVSIYPAMFNFSMPWDDNSDNTTNLSHYNHKPAGVSGYVAIGTGGRLYVESGVSQIKFLGSNITYSSCFPDKADADKIAPRMASFGINLVRWHLMDADWGGENLINYSAGNSRSFNAAALDKFDYFFAKMKEQGIYSNINLLAGRKFVSGDGLPASIDGMPWKEKQTPAMFNPVMIALQKEYALNLLTHVNPYTGLSYAEDPAVAFVEVLNEHGLLHSWHYGGMDLLSAEFEDELQAMWNSYLSSKYGVFASLVSSWGVSEPLGAEKLVNPKFTSGTTGWVMEQHAPAIYTLSTNTDGHSAGINSLDITVAAVSAIDWHAQFNQPVQVTAGVPYTLSFSAKASSNKTVGVIIQQVGGAWATRFTKDINLTPQWQRFEFVFTVTQDQPDARFNIYKMADAALTYSFADFSFRQGGELTGLKAGEESFDKISIFKSADRNDRPENGKRDWVDFLWQKEHDYWSEMNTYLKDTLGIKALTTGTVVETAPPNIMSLFDVVDSHAYWQHPSYLGAQGEYPWYLKNTSMTGNTRGGTIAALGMRRVHNKPFSVTEYGHPFPNTFDSEANLFLAAYGAFQGWDAIYPYTYDDGVKGWKLNKQRGYFDYGNHPGKMTSMIAAANIFRRGDAATGGTQIAVEFDAAAEREALINAGGWRLVDAETAGMPYETPLLYRCSMVTLGNAAPAGPGVGSVVVPVDKNFTSETGELNWNAGAKYFTINTPMTKSVTGYSAGINFVFNGIEIAPAAGLRNWSSVTMTLMKGNSLASGAEKILITAQGLVSNTAMTYRDYPGGNVISYPPADDIDITLRYSADWGTAPVMAEGINCSFVIPYPHDHIKVYALDTSGNRKTTIPVSDSSGNASFSINDSFETLWYEVEIFLSPAPTDTHTPMPTFTITPGGPTPTFTATPTQAQEPALFLIDDCEDMNSENMLEGYWYTYSDGVSAVNPGSSFTMSAGGALGSSASVRFHGNINPVYTPAPSGSPVYTYAGLGTQLNPNAGAPLYEHVDIRSYDGIMFYTKGDISPYYVRIPHINSLGETLTGYNDFRYSFIAGSAWTQVIIPFAEFTQQHGWGSLADISDVLANARDIQWQPEGTDRTFELFIDNLSFYRNPVIPMNSPTVTPTPAASVTPDNGDFRIKQFNTYPNPIIQTGKSFQLYLDFFVSGQCAGVELSIYTPGLRRIIQTKVSDALEKGSHVIPVSINTAARLGSGIYYGVIKAKNSAGETVLSKPQVIVVLGG